MLYQLSYTPAGDRSVAADPRRFKHRPCLDCKGEAASEGACGLRYGRAAFFTKLSHYPGVRLGLIVPLSYVLHRDVCRGGCLYFAVDASGENEQKIAQSLSKIHGLFRFLLRNVGLFLV